MWYTYTCFDQYHTTHKKKFEKHFCLTGFILPNLQSDGKFIGSFPATAICVKQQMTNQEMDIGKIIV
jgi:hypothetical protein